MIRVVKVLNNSVVLAVEEPGGEVILMGKGIGFGKSIGQQISPKEGEQVFVLRDRQLGEKNAITAEQLETLKDLAQGPILESLRAFAPQMGVTYGRVTIRCQKSRWGSCSGSGNLNFNCLLALAPREVLDYVVVHELAHRKHMDHSAAFWQEVGRVLPDYRARRDWLRRNGGALLARVG